MGDLENFVGRVINGDCRVVMNEMEEGCIDLIVTSCPYGVGIEYDVHDDDMTIDEYLKFSEEWLTAAFRVMKDDGRIALNIPYEINRQDKGGRVLILSEIWQIMKKIGYKFYGIVDLEEESPHRSRTTAWGSWMSPSAPYIYNPKECVVLAYKKTHVKKVKGEPQWKGEMTQVQDPKDHRLFKNKMVYHDDDKREFIDLVFGQWKYFADTKSLTKATFSMDIPTKAIKILSYRNDVVLDPFAGSGTSLVAAETLDRRWIGIELSPNYCEVANSRVKPFVEGKRQQVLDFNEKEGQ
jgi:site-specific DNA-methyltransferase (adenine-specific)